LLKRAKLIRIILVRGLVQIGFLGHQEDDISSASTSRVCELQPFVHGQHVYTGTQRCTRPLCP